MYVRRAVACNTVMFTAAENGRGVRCSEISEITSAEGTPLSICPMRVDNTRYLDICTIYLPHPVCIVAWPGTVIIDGVRSLISATIFGMAWRADYFLNWQYISALVPLETDFHKYLKQCQRQISPPSPSHIWNISHRS
jgi:hypothetical protein